jgi:hypothetical protein
MKKSRFAEDQIAFALRQDHERQRSHVDLLHILVKFWG